MSFRINLFAATCCATAFAGTCFASETYTCPTRITLASASVEVKDMPPGFESLAPAPVSYLTGSNMFDGHPKEKASLIPDFTSRNGEFARWNFDGDFPRGKWISCDYELGFVRLVKRVDDSVKTCTTTMRTLNKAQKLFEIRFDCK